MIVRSIQKDGNLRPAAVNYVDQIPAEALFHLQQQVRHPASTYSFSLDKLGNAFCSAAELYLSKTDEYRNQTSTLEMAELLTSYEIFLRCCQEHVDDYWLVLKSLVDPNSVKKKISSPVAEEFVVGVGLSGAKSFRDTLLNYKPSLRVINKVRHQQGRLRGIGIWPGGSVHLGYFVEEPDKAGHLGPSPELHPDRGAISFARDLSWHLANVYLYSEKLVRAIQAALSAKALSVSPKPEGNNETWSKVIALALRLPPACFPKEVPKGLVLFSLDDNGETLTIRQPHHARISFPADMRVTCSMMIDGHHRTYKVPFP